MKKLLVVCAVLLIAQLGLTVWTHIPEQSTTMRSVGDPLVHLATVDVNGLLLEDNQGHSLALTKKGNAWSIPSLQGFPADSGRIELLITKLSEVKRAWPEATTKEAATRFKVAPDQFERKLILKKDQSELAVLYFGSSAGLRRLYFRVADDNEVHSLNLSQEELALETKSWIDTRVLHLASEKITRISLPQLTLVRDKKGWQPADLKEKEQVNKTQIEGLVARLADLSITNVLPVKDKATYDWSKPVLQCSLELSGGKKLEYLFAKPFGKQTENKEDSPLAASVYALKVSGRERVFQVEGWQVDELKNTSRSAVIKGAVEEAAAHQAKEPATAPLLTPQLHAPAAASPEAEQTLPVAPTTGDTASPSAKEEEQTIPGPEQMEASQAGEQQEPTGAVEAAPAAQEPEKAAETVTAPSAESSESNGQASLAEEQAPAKPDLSATNVSEKAPLAAEVEQEEVAPTGEEQAVGPTDVAPQPSLEQPPQEAAGLDSETAGQAPAEEEAASKVNISPMAQGSSLDAVQQPAAQSSPAETAPTDTTTAEKKDGALTTPATTDAEQ